MGRLELPAEFPSNNPLNGPRILVLPWHVRWQAAFPQDHGMPRVLENSFAKCRQTRELVTQHSGTLAKKFAGNRAYDPCNRNRRKTARSEGNLPKQGNLSCSKKQGSVN